MESQVSNEVSLILDRLNGPADKRDSVLPVLLEGEAKDAFPPLLQPLIRADFRDAKNYFAALFDLFCTMLRCKPDDSRVQGLRQSLRAP